MSLTMHRQALLYLKSQQSREQNDVKHCANKKRGNTKSPKLTFH